LTNDQILTIEQHTRAQHGGDLWFKHRAHCLQNKNSMPYFTMIELKKANLLSKTSGNDASKLRNTHLY